MLHTDQVADYDKDGFGTVENVFSPPEVAALLRDIEGGAHIAANTHERADTSRKTAKLAIWPDIGPDMWGAATTSPRLISAFVALDPATRENGCLQVLRGSQKMGRLTQSKVAGQTEVEMDRLRQLEPLFERVHCEMSPGSVLFFDCNLLRRPRQPASDPGRRRRPAAVSDWP